MTYVKCHWDETRAGQYAAWGQSWWYFEFGPDGQVTRHVEIYDNGRCLRYDNEHIQDEYGGLAEARRQDMDMPDPIELTADQFEAVWASVKPGEKK